MIEAASSFNVIEPIYGNKEIADPVIVELIGSKPVQRLKKISQLGVPDEFFHEAGFSRFDHSLGVMLLLRRFWASEEEQVAGLLHDVSHTAFSHLHDWVFGDYLKPGNEEEGQEKTLASFILGSELKDILKRHGLDPKRIADPRNFSLLEQPIPELCADRIDYALRQLPAGLAKELVESLRINANGFIFTGHDIARLFALEFLNLQMEHWGGYEAVARHHILAKVLKRALKAGTIGEEDFLGDEDSIIRKLKVTSDEVIRRDLGLLRRTSIPVADSGVVVYKKFRYVDPRYIENGGLVLLSEADSDFAKRLKAAREKNKEGVLVPV